jgi:hypothetical protein
VVHPPRVELLKEKEHQLLERTPNSFRGAGERSNTSKTRCFAYWQISLTGIMTSRKALIQPIAVVRLYFLFAAGSGILSLLRLLTLPADQKNAALWGYSMTRLAMLIFILLGILFCFGLLVATFWQPQWAGKKLAQLCTAIETPGMLGFYLFMLPILTVSGGLLWVFWMVRITDQFFLAYLVRLAPIVIWFAVLGALTLLLLICLGYQRKTLVLNVQFAFSTFPASIQRGNLYRALGITVILSGLCLGVLYCLLPAQRLWFVAEDHFLENLTTGFFLFAFLLSMLILIANRGGQFTDFAVPAAGLLCFLEEISYGERYFESVPLIDPDKGVDAFHDYFNIGFEFIRRGENNLLVYLAAGSLLVLILLAIYFAAQHFQKMRYPKPWGTFGPLIFTLISAALILVALVLDLGVIDKPGHRLIEEILEFSASLALLFGAISIYQRIVFEGRPETSTARE